MDDSIRGQYQFCSWNSKSPATPPPASNNEEEEARCRKVEEIISGGGHPQDLKMEHVRLYLRKHSLRIKGTKQEMIQRLQEFLELKNNGGLTKYPVDSFVVDCIGDVNVGDTILFPQKVYEKTMSKASTLPPLGERLVAGRVIKESSTVSKTSQRCTVTVETLWSTGVGSLPPLYPLTVSHEELYELYTYRQLRPSEVAIVRAMKKQAIVEASAGIRAMEAREVAGTSNDLHEQSNDKQGAAIQTAKSEVEDEGSTIDRDKEEQSNDKQGAALRTTKSEVEGEGSTIDRDKGKPVLIDLEDHNMKSNTKEDDQHLTPAHNASASQEPGIMETETPEDEVNNEKQIQAEFKEDSQIGSGHQVHEDEVNNEKQIQAEFKEDSQIGSGHQVHEDEVNNEKQIQAEFKEDSQIGSGHQVHSNDMGGKQGFFRCKKRKYNMQEEKLEENLQQQSEAADDDEFFKNLDDGQDDSKMGVPEKEMPDDISVDPPGGLSPKTAREKYEQWCSITPGFNIKLGNHCPGEKSAVIPDFTAEVVDNRVSAAAPPQRKSSKRQMRQYLWLIRKRMKHPALPRRQYGRILTANTRNRRWPSPVKCYISDCPQKAARKCLNKLCRSCCVAVGGFCIRHPR